MDLLKNMNSAITFIEDNLTDDIDFKEAASLAYCSEYHFKRMFSFLAGITLFEYIRRTRLTLAAFELRNHSMKVIDIAVQLTKLFCTSISVFLFLTLPQIDVLIFFSSNKRLFEENSIFMS